MGEKKNNKKKIIITTILVLTGISAATISSAIIAYDTVFNKTNRPNYDLYPGLYTIDRLPHIKRKEVWILSGKNKLKTYIYDAKSSKGLVVLSHGLNAGADDYLPIIEYLLENNFSVIAHNVTGTYESDGDSSVGACQSLIDLENVITYIEQSEYQYYPLFLLGHSWGGYAASSVLSIKKNIKACALLAPMCDAPNIMIAKGEQYVGSIANATKPIFGLYQKILFKEYVIYNGVKGINDSNIPVLIAHGVDDKIITYHEQSITSRKNDITNPNVIYYVGEGLNGGHTSIWHSKESEEYQLKVNKELKKLEFEQDKINYCKTVDHRLYSDLNYELMIQIIELYNSVLK